MTNEVWEVCPARISFTVLVIDLQMLTLRISPDGITWHRSWEASIIIRARILLFAFFNWKPSEDYKSHIFVWFSAKQELRYRKRQITSLKLLYTCYQITCKRDVEPVRNETIDTRMERSKIYPSAPSWNKIISLSLDRCKSGLLTHSVAQIQNHSRTTRWHVGASWWRAIRLVLHCARKHRNLERWHCDGHFGQRRRVRRASVLLRNCR